MQFNILEHRNKWKKHLYDAKKEIPNLDMSLGNSPSNIIKKALKIEFHDYILKNTNENTTREELIELFDVMDNNIQFPNERIYHNSVIRDHYEKVWKKLIRTNRQWV